MLVLSFCLEGNPLLLLHGYCYLIKSLHRCLACLYRSVVFAQELWYRNCMAWYHYEVVGVFPILLAIVRSMCLFQCLFRHLSFIIFYSSTILFNPVLVSRLSLRALLEGSTSKWVCGITFKHILIIDFDGVDFSRHSISTSYQTFALSYPELGTR